MNRERASWAVEQQLFSSQGVNCWNLAFSSQANNEVSCKLYRAQRPRFALLGKILTNTLSGGEFLVLDVTTMSCTGIPIALILSYGLRQIQYQSR